MVFAQGARFPGLPVTVKCGQCIGCRVDRTESWAIRIMHESVMHEASCFLTLTYDDENLPSDGSLRVRDWQLFAKRLRKRVGRFRFFHAGEYGEKTLRPHYHAALFGVDFSDDRKLYKRGRYPLWNSPSLEDCWGLGHAVIGSLTPDSARYIAKYCCKKVNGFAKEEHYTRIDPDTGEVFSVCPEYATMSRNKGIGHEFYERFGGDLRRDDFVPVDGRRKKLPKFYDERWKALDEDGLRRAKRRREAFARRRADNNTPERLRVRYECLDAKFRREHGGII